MKKIFLVALLAIVFITNVKSQTVEQKIVTYMASYGYTLSSSSEYTYLAEGSSKSFYKTFEAGLDYAVVAFSESVAVYDVDLFCYTTSGVLQAKATDSNDWAMLTYTAKSYDNRYILTYKNYDSASSSSTYKIKCAIFYK